MPVPVKKKTKNTTGAKKKSVSSNGAGVKTTKQSSQNVKKAIRKPKVAKVEPRKPTETTQLKSNSKAIKETAKPLKKQYSTSSFGKNKDLNEQKALKMTKIHPEVNKLVNILKASIKEEINESTNRLKYVKSEINQSYNNLQNIKEEIRTESEENSTCEPWGYEYGSSDSSDDEDFESGSCSDSECSCCCTDTDTDTDTDDTSSCSDVDEDDENNNSYSKDDASSSDEESTDEYSNNDFTNDTDDDSCSGCDTCMPSTSMKKHSMNHTGTVKFNDIKPTIMQKANQLPKKCNTKTTKIIPKQKLNTEKIINKKPKVAMKPKPKAVNSVKKGASNKAVKLKKTAANTKAGQTKKNIAKPNIRQSKKKVVTKAGQSKKSTTVTQTAALKGTKPLTEITNVNPTRAANSNNKIVIKKPCHAFKPTCSNLAASKSSTTALTSSGCCTWASALTTPKSSIIKPNTKRDCLPLTFQQSKPALTSALRGRRSIGVSCHLPDANSTFQNNWSEKLWRY